MKRNRLATLAENLLCVFSILLMLIGFIVLIVFSLELAAKLTGIKP